jgi:hypothetical protein
MVMVIANFTVFREYQLIVALSPTDERLQFPMQYPTSCLLGCVYMIDCLPQEEYRVKFPDGESDSPFVFICQDAQGLPIRFPIQGKHKICKLYVI